jgi:uronate dehydrogenase
VLGFVAQHQGERPLSSASVAPGSFRNPATLDNLPAADRILMLGAGGPIGAAAADELRQGYRLRLADLRSMREVAAAPPQSEGAPLPKPAVPPHEERTVDITDSAAVLDAADGMDAIVNLAVVRPDPVEAFRVNTLGAYHVMQAAVHHGIRRVIHTGPALTLSPHPGGYAQDRNIEASVPPRPGDDLYFVSKFLGQEICRVFAEHHQIACPALLYCGFVDPATAARRERIPHPFTISWQDSGRSIAAALRVTRIAQPFEVIHVLADSPHDRYRNDAARRVLGWEPQDRLEHLWRRQESFAPLT